MKRLSAAVTFALLALFCSALPRVSRAQQPDKTIDAATRALVIDSVIKMFNESYVFPEVAKVMEQALRERVRRGNTGYIELHGFTDAEAGAETVAAAMNFVANTNALIIDLRRNGGGQPEMVALISSYLFGPEPVHLNDLYWREGNRT